MTLGRASEQKQVEQIPGGLKVLDATGQALKHVRRIALNVAKLSGLLTRD